MNNTEDHESLVSESRRDDQESESICSLGFRFITNIPPTCAFFSASSLIFSQLIPDISISELALFLKDSDKPADFTPWLAIGFGVSSLLSCAQYYRFSQDNRSKMNKDVSWMIVAALVGSTTLSIYQASENMSAIEKLMTDSCYPPG